MTNEWRPGHDGPLSAGRLCRAAGFALLAAAAAAPAGAQATKLTGPEIVSAFSGKTLRVRTERYFVGEPGKPTGTQRRTKGDYVVFQLVVRPDNSIIFRCTYFDPKGQPSDCDRPGSQRREVGVWSLEGDRFCYQWVTAVGSQKLCQHVWREGAQFRFRQASGPASLVDGEIVEVM